MQTWLDEIPLLTQGRHDRILAQVAKIRRRQTVYPDAGREFYALKRTPFNAVKAVILGQDPYHGPGQAQGLAFSVPRGVKTPPSLRNIFKEIAADLGGDPDDRPPDLTSWADQGVLLLNSILTVEAGQPASHRHLGWEELTDQIIKGLGAKRTHLVFMLWGAPAQKKAPLIKGDHLVLQAPHPSPLSAYRGFFGCRHFSQANRYLKKHGVSPIEW
jgi:uracil-DNA glycosylase